LKRTDLPWLLLNFCVLTIVFTSSLLGESRPHLQVSEITPILFEPLPSTGSTAQMLGRVPGATFRFAPRSIEFETAGVTGHSLRITFAGAQSGLVTGMGRLPSETNYLIGSDASSWRTHVPNFSRLAYKGLYPGVDAVFYGNAQRLEHDFIVAPGADYRPIRMHFPAEAHPVIESSGDLRLRLSDGDLRIQRPVIYQDHRDGRRSVASAFRTYRNGDIGFAVGAYDTSLPLIIDPVLSFSTYLANVFSDINFVATDGSGASYIAGIGSTGYPASPGSFPGCSQCAPQQAITYVSKLSPDGKTLLYTTLLGGSAYSQPSGIAVDAAGNALVAGACQSPDFPTKNGQPLGTNGTGSGYAYLASLAPDGASLNYATLLGGGTQVGQSSGTGASAIAVDSQGSAYIAGTTDAPAFPLTPGALHALTPGYPKLAIFLSKFTSSGSLVYSGILGDSEPQNGGGGPIGVSRLTVDSAGNAFVAGQAGSLWPTTAGAFQLQIGGTTPYAGAFVTKVAPDGGSLVYSTFAGHGQVTGISVLPNGNVWLAGVGSTGLAMTPGAYQSSAGNSYLLQLDAAGANLLYASYFGTTETNIQSLAADVDGDVWIAGQTTAGIPLVKPLQSAAPLASNLGSRIGSFVAQFDPTATVLKFSSLLGGTAAGSALGVAVDANHRAHVSGFAAPGMYTTAGAYLSQVPPPMPAYDPVYGYAVMIDPAVDAPALCLPSTGGGGLSWPSTRIGSRVDLTLTLSSCGTQPLTISSVQTAAAPYSVPAAENTCPQSLPVGQSCTVGVRFAPTTVASFYSTLTVTTDAPVPQATLPLGGTGVAPHLFVLGNVMFDLALVGQTTRAAGLTVGNSGGAPLNIDFSKTTVSGDFAIPPNQSCAAIQGDSFCGIVVTFTPTAPGTRTGTLQIASDDPNHPLTSLPLTATGYAAAPAPQITFIENPTIAAGSTGISLRISGFGFMPTSTVQVNGRSQSTTFGGPYSLTANLDSSVIPVTGYAELPVTIVTPVPGGGRSAPYTLTIYERILTLNAGMVYEPVSQRLFVSVPASAANDANTILPIDPAHATVGTPITVGNDPGKLAVSADGQYLYVALNGAHALQRLNLANGSIERTFPLPTDPSSAPLTVSDLHVVPGAPTSVVATLSAVGSPPEDGIALFGNGGLVNYLPGDFVQNGANTTLQLDNFAFTGDPSSLYAMPFEVTSDPYFFTVLTLDGTGLHYLRPNPATAPDQSGNHGRTVVSDGSLLYTDSGQVWDPVKRQLLHTYAVPGVLNDPVPDKSTGKTFFLDQTYSLDQNAALAIRAYDQTTLAQTGTLAFPRDPVGSFPSFSTQLQRWGASGLAFRFSDGTGTGIGGDSVVLVSSGIVTGNNLNSSPTITALAPATLVAGGPDFTLAVAGTGFIPGSTVVWNDTPRVTTYVSGTQLTATIYASDIAVAGTAKVAVITGGVGGGVSPVQNVTITSTIASVSQLTIAPESLTFMAQATGSTSPAQSITLTNSGQVDITAITVGLAGADAASFAQNSNCSSTLAPGSTCQIQITFSPQAAGARNAILNIGSSANAAPQALTLTGIGSVFAFVAPSAGGSSTVASGQTANYSLQIVPGTGYSGTLTLSCANLPAHAACTFSPATLTVTSGALVSASLSIQTSQSQTASLHLVETAPPLLALLALPWLRRRFHVLSGRAVFALFLMAVSVGCAVGCGGDGQGSSAPPPTQTAQTVAPGTYSIQVVASDGTNKATQGVSLVVQ
jgi:hypothetical protein